MDKHCYPCFRACFDISIQYCVLTFALCETMQMYSIRCERMQYFFFFLLMQALVSMFLCLLWRQHSASVRARATGGTTVRDQRPETGVPFDCLILPMTRLMYDWHCTVLIHNPQWLHALVSVFAFMSSLFCAKCKVSVCNQLEN